METVIEIAVLILALFLWALLFSFPVMFLWNDTMPLIFNLPEISLWKAFELTFLCTFLFKSNSSSSKKD